MNDARKTMRAIHSSLLLDKGDVACALQQIIDAIEKLQTGDTIHYRAFGSMPRVLDGESRSVMLRFETHEEESDEAITGIAKRLCINAGIEYIWWEKL